MKKRFLATLMTVCMIVSTLPATAFAMPNGPPPGVGDAAVCPHHEHDETCGWAEAVPETPCGHLNEDGTYLCDPGMAASPSVAAADYVCPHGDGCGYVPGTPGHACGFNPADCELCNPEEHCSCDVLCTEDAINSDCPVCGAKNADLAACEGTANPPALMGAAKSGEITGSWFSFDPATGTLTVKSNEGCTEWKHESSIAQSDIVTVVVEEGVTSIEDDAFSGCTGLTELTLPEQLTSIGDSAFSGCTGLNELTLPEQLTSIGHSAFKDCTGLTELTLPTTTTLTYIGDYAFQGCTGLTELTLPTTLTSIGDYAFYGCTGLKKLSLPEQLTSIGHSAFSGCTGLTELTLPEQLTSIGDYAFYGCTGLTELTLPEQLTSIGRSMFSGCTGLTELTLPEQLTSIGDYAFYGCTGLKKLSLPEQLTSIGDFAFSGCTGLNELTLPEQLTSIGDYAFYGCTGLTELTLPEQLTSIGHSMFSGCTGLNELTLPEQLTSIGDYAFYGCTGLNELSLPKQLTSIGNSAFYGCTGLNELSLPEQLTSIGDYAFKNCTGLTKLTLPEQLTSIGRSMFSGCPGLTELTLPEQLTSIADSAFQDCTGLIKLISPAMTAPSLGIAAFNNANSAFAIYISEGATGYDQGNWNGYIKKFVKVPMIATHPHDESVTEGDTATFKVAATGTPTPTYQWRYSTNSGGTWQDVTDGTGSNTASYTTPAATASMNGYQYQCVVTNNMGTITSVAATLTVTTPILTYVITATPAEGGTVTGGGTYTQDTDVTVTAAADTGCHFVRWTENGTAVSTSAAYTFTATADRSLTAMFERDVVPPTVYTVSVSATPAEGGTVMGGGTYTQDTDVTVTAAADTGCHFVRWTENGTAVSTSAAYTFTATADRSLTAMFERDVVPPTVYTVSVSATPAEGGTVMGGGTYTQDTDVTVTAAADTGCHFVRWTENGTAVSTGAAYTFTATADRSLTAVFERDVVPPTVYTVTFDAAGGSPATQTALTGAGGKLTALPAATRGGYSFDGWYTAQTGGDAVTPETVFIQDGTVYAHWTARSSGGGDSSSSVSTPVYDSRTLADTATGVKVTGSSVHERAALTVRAGGLHDAGDAGCDLLRKAQEAGHVLSICDVSLSRSFRGDVTVTLPVAGRDGQTLTVAQCVGGRLTLSDVKAANGAVAVTTRSLSVFAVLDGVYTVETLAAPAAPAPVADAPRRYRVQRGDTLWGISRRYHCTVAQLVAANPFIKDPDLIRPGWELIIP